MLARCNLPAREPFGLSHRRQPPAFPLFVGGVVAVLLVECEKPVE